MKQLVVFPKPVRRKISRKEKPLHPCPFPSLFVLPFSVHFRQFRSPHLFIWCCIAFTRCFGPLLAGWLLGYASYYIFMLYCSSYTIIWLMILLQFVAEFRVEICWFKLKCWLVYLFVLGYFCRVQFWDLEFNMMACSHSVFLWKCYCCSFFFCA